MGWPAKLLKLTPGEDLQGILLDTTRPYWELDGKTRFAPLLRALADLLPSGSVLYFEGGSPDRDLLDFFDSRAIPEQTHVAVSTLWPRPAVYHIPATPENLEELAVLAESHAQPELAVHVHAYRDAIVLLEWHDAFAQPMLLNGQLNEDAITSFARTLNMTATLNPGAGESMC